MTDIQRDIVRQTETMQGRDIKRGKVTGTERYRETQKDREEQVEEKKHYRSLTGFL